MDTLKGILLLPVGALLFLPFLLLASRLMAVRRLSFGAAFLLGLILGAVMLVMDLLTAPLVPDSAAGIVVWFAASLAFSTAICGYLITTVEGRSVGALKGFYFTMLSQGLFTAAFFAVGAVVVLAMMTLAR